MIDALVIGMMFLSWALLLVPIYHTYDRRAYDSMFGMLYWGSLLLFFVVSVLMFYCLFALFYDVLTAPADYGVRL